MVHPRHTEVRICIGERGKCSLLTICTIRVGTHSVLFSLPCTYLVELELEYQVHVHSEALVRVCWRLSWCWRWYSSMISRFTVISKLWTGLAVAHGLSFHSGALRRGRGRGISPDVKRRGNSPTGRPHWSGSLLNFDGHQTPELVVSGT